MRFYDQSTSARIFRNACIYCIAPLAMQLLQDNVDLGELQEKMSRMKVQMKNVENQLDAGRQS